MTKRSSFTMLDNDIADQWMATWTFAEFKVFWALSRHADRNGVSWPSYSRISEITGLDRGTIRKSLKKLEEKMVIRRESRERIETIYSILGGVYGAPSKPSKNSRGSGVHGAPSDNGALGAPAPASGGAQDRELEAPRPPELNKELNQEPDALALDRRPVDRAHAPAPPGTSVDESKPAPTFDDFWNVVHQKVGKVKAKAAWAQAVARKAKDDGLSQTESAAFIVEAMTEFSASPASHPTDRNAINPATWLSEGRYDDDRTAWRANGHSRSSEPDIGEYIKRNVKRAACFLDGEVK